LRLAGLKLALGLKITACAVGAKGAISAILLGLLCLKALALEGVLKLSPPALVETPPDRFVTLAFNLRNEGESALELLPEAFLPQGWTLISSLAPFSLAAGEARPIFVTFFVPPATGARDYPLKLRVTLLERPEEWVEATARVRVLPVVKLKLIAPEGRAVKPGERVSYTFTLVHRGNVEDLVRLSATSSHGFPVELEDEVALLPGERRPINVEVTIPSEAHEGTDHLKVIASSTRQEGVAAEATVLTRILPPGPEAVQVGLFLELPVLAELRFDPSRREGELDLETAVVGRGLELEGGLTLGLPQLALKRALLAVRALPPGLLGLSLERLPEGGSLELALLLPLGSLRVGLAHLTGERLRGKLEFALAEGLPLSGSASLRTIAEAGTLYKATELHAVARIFEAAGVTWAVEGNLFRFDPGFPGAGGADSAGSRLAMRLEFKPFLFLASHESSGHELSTDCPLGRRTDRFLFHLSSGPLGAWTVEWSRFEEGETVTCVAGPPFARLSRSRAMAEWAYSLGLLNLSLSAGSGELISIGREEETAFDIRGFRFAAALSLPPWEPSLSLLQELTISQESGEVVDHLFSWDLALKFGAPSLPLRMTVALFASEKHIGVETGFELERPELTASLGSRIAVGGFAEEAELAFQAGLQLQAEFRLPTPIPIKGGLEGYVFIDGDRDRRRDPGEPGVPDIVLQVGGVRVSTGKEGFYRFPGLEPGRYLLRLEGLPPGLAPLIPPPEVEIVAGKVIRLDIPLARVALILGLVFEDLDRDGQRAAGEPGMARVSLVLERLPEGRALAEAITNARGRFSFVELMPGTYKVRLVLASLPPRYEPTTPAEAIVTLDEGERAELVFGVAERPRPVVVEQLPVPRFTFTPERPRAGETVTFDASESYDPDGEIIRYEWDFDGDGSIDAEGMIVKHTFTEPGSYPVTLTVVDNDGNSASLRKVVEVE